MNDNCLMNIYLETLRQVQDEQEFWDIYDREILFLYRATDLNHLMPEVAAKAYHNRTGDNCGFTVLMHAQLTLELLRTAELMAA